MSSSASSTTACSDTPPTVPSAAGSLLPTYTFLAHCIHHNLNKASRHSLSPPTAPSLSLDVSGLVASFLWFPLRTASMNSLHTRTSWLRDDPSLPYCTGEVHADTQQHDGWSSELHGRILRGWRLRAIAGWGGMYANGLGVTYAHPSAPSETFELAAVYGNHHSPQQSQFELETGERIVQVSCIPNTWMLAVRFDTSHGRQYQLGQAGHRDYWQSLLPTADKLHGRQIEALAFVFGVGGHIHNLGVYYQLLSPPASERGYGSAETLVAVLSRTGAVSHTAVEDESISASSTAAAGGTRSAFFWRRGFHLGRAQPARTTAADRG